MPRRRVREGVQQTRQSRSAHARPQRLRTRHRRLIYAWIYFLSSLISLHLHSPATSCTGSLHPAQCLFIVLAHERPSLPFRNPSLLHQSPIICSLCTSLLMLALPLELSIIYNMCILPLCCITISSLLIHLPMGFPSCRASASRLHCTSPHFGVLHHFTTLTLKTFSLTHEFFSLHLDPTITKLLYRNICLICSRRVPSHRT